MEPARQSTPGVVRFLIDGRVGCPTDSLSGVAATVITSISKIGLLASVLGQGAKPTTSRNKRYHDSFLCSGFTVDTWQPLIESNFSCIVVGSKAL